jgi:hypothetical protein
MLPIWTAEIEGEKVLSENLGSTADAKKPATITSLLIFTDFKFSVTKADVYYKDITYTCIRYIMKYKQWNVHQEKSVSEVEEEQFPLENKLIP